MPRTNYKKHLPRISAILIYGYLAVLAYMFLKIGGLDNDIKIKHLAIYIPSMIATLYIFMAGLNWSAGMYTERPQLMLFAFVQYIYLFYFAFIMKASEGGFNILDYYRRAIYFLPVIVIQILIDRSLKRDGTFTIWFARQKFILNILIALACLWNFYAFQHYFDLTKSGF